MPTQPDALLSRPVGAGAGSRGLDGLVHGPVCAKNAIQHSIAAFPFRLRGARLDALMATWLVPPALAVALEVTLPTYAELTPMALTSVVLHTPLTVARLVLRKPAIARSVYSVPWQGDSSTGVFRPRVMRCHELATAPRHLAAPREERRGAANTVAEECPAGVAWHGNMPQAPLTL